MICIIKIVLGIAIVVIINLKELLNSESRAKVMIIYFFITGVALALAVLINHDNQFPNPFIALMDAFKALGLEAKQ